MKLNFPKQFEEDLEKSIKVYEEVEKTHKGLGKLALFEVLSDIANRCILVVGCSGTGKSVISNMLYEKINRSKLKIDAITVSGLRRIAKVLNFNTCTVVVDDLSKGQTEYSQIATVSVFSSLCYSHEITKFTGQLELQILGFHGSAIINLQPLLLRKIARLPEFETDIKNKTIRYYHLHFPVEENINPPNISTTWKYLNDFNLKFEDKVTKSQYYRLAFENFMHEHDRARAKEHLIAYLNASAWLNERDKITKADTWLIYQISKNFKIEPYIMIKDNLEGRRKIDPNLLPLLSAIATWKTPRIRDLMFRFGLKKTRLYEIIRELTDYVLLVKNKGIVIPTKETKQLLKEIGEW